MRRAVLRGRVCRLEECLSLIVFKAKHVCPKVGGSRGQNCTRQSGHPVALEREVRAVVSPGCSSLTPVISREAERAGRTSHTHFLQASTMAQGESPMTRPVQSALWGCLLGRSFSCFCLLLSQGPWVVSLKSLLCQEVLSAQ